MGDEIERLLAWCREHPEWELEIKHKRIRQRFLINLTLVRGETEIGTMDMYHPEDLRLMRPCCQKLVGDLIAAAEGHIAGKGGG